MGAKVRLLGAAALIAGLATGAAFAQTQSVAPAYPSESPARFTPVMSSFDFERRDVMIPMRDGVKLKTVIWIPKGAHRAPILLTRTPYNASDRSSEDSEHLAAVIGNSDAAGELVTQEGYIRVLQDVRGKYGSEGDYQMNRAPAGPQNPTGIDDSTDCYDTIDWLVKNLPESNGKVGILGISYDGFTSVMALFHPHPALKAAMPINPMVDGWMGDDWFHQGAFRTGTLGYIYEQEATRKSSEKWWADSYDDYSSWLDAGSVGDMAATHGLEQTGFWNKILAHPAYDAFWQDQALDKLLAKQGLSVPTMLVHSLWDQEDIYGAQAIWRAVKPGDSAGLLYMTMGPWFHHQARLNGDAVGNIKFDSDTAAWFRREVLAPFFDHYLKDDSTVPTPSTVTAYVTGENRWEHLSTWPQGCESGCRIEHRLLYLQTGGKLGFTAPTDARPGYTAYVSDPAKPIPFLPRPVHIEGEEGEHSWQTWLTSDQRPAAARPDVLTFTSAPLDKPLKLAGQPIANLVASTTGTDGDFVVKLIDVYPDEVGRDPKMGGYELMVAVDIMRGRYRESFAVARPIPAGRPLPYKVTLPNVNHVFLPGHRLMVQVQSTLFPIYDRNPQTFVPNIFEAKAGDYRSAEIHVYDAGASASAIDLPVVLGQ
jgi:putative CocE/NonD family hydrolase